MKYRLCLRVLLHLTELSKWYLCGNFQMSDWGETERGGRYCWWALVVITWWNYSDNRVLCIPALVCVSLGGFVRAIIIQIAVGAYSLRDCMFLNTLTTDFTGVFKICWGKMWLGKSKFSHMVHFLILKVKFKLSQHIGARNYPLIK